MSRCRQEMHKMTNKHKMFEITSYQRNSNQNKKDIPFTSIKLSKIILKIIVETIGKSVRKWSFLYTVDRRVT